MAQQIPRDRSPDSTLALLREGYLFIPRRCRRFRSDIFRGRLMGEHTIFISGAEAAEVFYDDERFRRTGAIPRRIQRTLFGKGGVQMLDDAAHRHRKAMFMSLMTPGNVAAMADLTAEFWRTALTRWAEGGSVVLFSEAQEILCRAACAWAGVPLDESEVRRRAADLAAMVDSFGGVGPRHWRGWWARRRTERWIGGIVERVRRGDLKADQGTALHVVTHHRELDDSLLAARTAAVELINLLRPTVAIAYFVAFAALALHEHPRCRGRLRDGDEDYVAAFVHEVRRFYPFAPLVGARVRRDFVWRGYDFRAGTLVLLDIYGTDHDPRRWERPEEFMPERFERSQWNQDPFGFIPQGGGDPDTGHRCAGEAITIEVMKVATRFLSRYMDYDVPPQDLGFRLDRVPTRPRSGFLLGNVTANRGDARSTVRIGVGPP